MNSRPTEYEKASLASLFRPRWCPIVKVPMNSEDRAGNLIKNCGPIVKAHMNPYNRAAVYGHPGVITVVWSHRARATDLEIEVPLAATTSRQRCCRRRRRWGGVGGGGGAYLAAHTTWHGQTPKSHLA